MNIKILISTHAFRNFSKDIFGFAIKTIPIIKHLRRELGKQYEKIKKPIHHPAIFTFNIGRYISDLHIVQLFDGAGISISNRQDFLTD